MHDEMKMSFLCHQQAWESLQNELVWEIKGENTLNVQFERRNIS